MAQALASDYKRAMSDKPDPFSAPFGTLFGDHMTVAKYHDGDYDYSGPQPLENFSLHPATHVLHYASECFEGLKAHRQVDGSVAIFRLEDSVQRMLLSIEKLRMVPPSADLLRQLMIDATTANASFTPDPPGSLYIRPTMIGTAPNIGAAATPSIDGLLYVINSPVGDYFAGGVRPLTIYIETETPRTTPQFGSVKSGANYVMALGPTLDAKRDHVADQVLFASGDDVTETGASNFFLADEDRIITRNLDDSFLHGITRKSIIQIAQDLGMEVEERSIPVSELQAWAEHGEMFLSGTAAVIAPVGKVIAHGQHIDVRDSQPGPTTLKLREALTDVQTGKAEDVHGWLTPLEAR